MANLDISFLTLEWSISRCPLVPFMTSTARWKTTCLVSLPLPCSIFNARSTAARESMAFVFASLPLHVNELKKVMLLGWVLLERSCSNWAFTGWSRLSIWDWTRLSICGKLWEISKCFMWKTFSTAFNSTDKWQRDFSFSFFIGIIYLLYHQNAICCKLLISCQFGNMLPVCKNLPCKT